MLNSFDVIIDSLPQTEQWRKKGDCPIIANPETATALESLEGPFSGLTW